MSKPRLNCPEHGYMATRQNRSLVDRVLGQLGNPGDAIFAAAGRKNPSRRSSAKPLDRSLVKLVRDANAGKPERRSGPPNTGASSAPRPAETPPAGTIPLRALRFAWHL
jgi:hypothetical protein